MGRRRINLHCSMGDIAKCKLAQSVRLGALSLATILLLATVAHQSTGLYNRHEYAGFKSGNRALAAVRAASYASLVEATLPSFSVSEKHYTGLPRKLKQDLLPGDSSLPNDTTGPPLHTEETDLHASPILPDSKSCNVAPIACEACVERYHIQPSAAPEVRWGTAQDLADVKAAWEETACDGAGVQAAAAQE